MSEHLSNLDLIQTSINILLGLGIASTLACLWRLSQISDRTERTAESASLRVAQIHERIERQIAECDRQIAALSRAVVTAEASIDSMVEDFGHLERRVGSRG